MAHRLFLADLGREQVPILFLSGVADLQQVAARVGTAYYLPKPFSLDSLLKVLAQVLREHAAPTYPGEHAAQVHR
jgi:DNA-binding response OmpR family regulator